MANKPASEPTTVRVRDLIGSVSVASVSAWLKLNGFPHSAASRSAITNRVALLIERDRLSFDEFQAAVIGIEEAGAKKILFFEMIEKPGTPFSTSEVRSRLTALKVVISPSRIFAPKKPKSSTLVYAMVTGAKVRVKWAEMHEAPVVDLDSSRVVWEPRRKVVVLTADFDTKKVEIRFDKPEKKHPHGTGKGAQPPHAYFSAYRVLTEELLGCDLLPSELRPALKDLIEVKPRAVVVVNEDHTNPRRFRTRTTSRKGDVRDDEDWQAAHQRGGSNWVYDAHSFYWLPEMAGGKLGRLLFSHLDATTSALRVLADCTDEEVDYAIGQVRARQITIPDSSATS